MPTGNQQRATRIWSFLAHRTSREQNNPSIKKQNKQAKKKTPPTKRLIKQNIKQKNYRKEKRENEKNVLTVVIFYDCNQFSAIGIHSTQQNRFRLRQSRLSNNESADLTC
jgi:cell shape-determining protein MreC